jgi:hypothetical protein
VFDRFLQTQLLLPIGWMILQTVRYGQGKLANITALTFIEVLAASQSSFIKKYLNILNLKFRGGPYLDLYIYEHVT